MTMKVSNAVNAARGHWPRILPALGIKVIPNRHQPCPMCQGKDRFRFDDKEGRGTWFCNNCSAGDGLELVKRALQLSASGAADRVNSITGNLPPQAIQPVVQHDPAADHRTAAALAARLLQTARTTDTNAYLARKGFPSQACRVLSQLHSVATVSYRPGDLVVPLYTLSGELVNLQLINADGVKRTLKSGQVKGTTHTLSTTDAPTKRIWIAEGYATALTVHNLTGETVKVALSSSNLLSLASLLHEQSPGCQIIIAADRDLSGAGQDKATTAARACNGLVALPPVYGDWNDAFMQHGEAATRDALQAAIIPATASPFDTMSEAEFTAMSASEKAMRINDHYRQSLAVDPNGEILYRYDAGAWKVIAPAQFAREVAALFQRLRAPFSSGKISGVLDTLKLILPQRETPARRLIGFRNGVLDTTSGTFSPHRRENWLRTVCSVDFTAPVKDETLSRDAPNFWRWLDRAAGGNAQKRDIILAALFMVLANRYDWQLFLEVTGPGGSGKSIMAEIATMLAGADNTTSATIETLESSRERAAVIGYSLIILPDQEKWSGDGAGIKAITGGDAVSVDPKYRDAYSTHIPAVILAVNNNPMRFTDRSGGVSRRRVILHFPEQIAPQERDLQLKDKISQELAVIVRQLMQRFSQPTEARQLLQSQQNSDEAVSIKRDADPLCDFCGYLEALPDATGLYMGNGNIRPVQPRHYLYHAYLTFMEANGNKNVLSLKMFGLGLPGMMKEFGLTYIKKHTRNGTQTNLKLSEDSNADWLPKCGEPVTEKLM